MKMMKKKMKNNLVVRWTTKLLVSVYRWLFETQEDKKKRLICEKTCEAVERTTTTRSEHNSVVTSTINRDENDGNSMEGPVSTDFLAELYEQKGVYGPGSLVEIFNDEMPFLLKEHVAEKFEGIVGKAHADPKMYSGGSKSSAMILGTVTMQDKMEASKPVKKTEYKSHVYLVRSWSDYKSRVRSGLPWTMEAKGEWKIAMFLGIEKFEDKEWVDWSEERDEDNWVDAKWAKWLIEDQVYVGWIHPGAMRKFGFGREWW